MRLLLLLALTSLTHAAPRSMRQTLNFAGTRRTYEIYLPANYREGTKTPLMIAFHPHHGTGRGMERITGFDTLADAHGFIVAYPDSDPNYSDGRSWNTYGANSDVDFAMALKADIEQNFSIDTSKIYVSGFSQGGGLVQALACAHGDAFAGAAVVSDNLNPRSEARCSNPHAIPLVFFHGTADPISPYNGGANGTRGSQTYSAQDTAAFWAKVNGCKEQPSTQTFADRLDDHSAVTDNLQTWSSCTKSVRFYTITGGGHTWPSGNTASRNNGPTSQGLNASETIWNNLTGQAPGAALN